MEHALKKLLLALFAISFVSCSKANDVPSASTNGSATNAQNSNSSIYPHSDSFKTTLTHGQIFLSDKMACVKCHGADYRGGATKVSCYTCHSAYPHPPSWALPSGHGATYESFDDNQRAQCLRCHTGPTSENPAATCKTCHAAFPHSDDFISGMDNHPALARTYEGKCTACHTDLTRNMPNLGSCQACHGDKRPEMHWMATDTATATDTNTSSTTSTSTATNAALSARINRNPSSAHKRSRSSKAPKISP